MQPIRNEKIIIALDCVYVVVQWLSLLHNFIQQSLNSSSGQAQSWSRRIKFAMARTFESDQAGNMASRLSWIKHSSKTNHHHHLVLLYMKQLTQLPIFWIRLWNLEGFMQSVIFPVCVQTHVPQNASINSY